MAQLLIAGCGYVGTALGDRFARHGNTVWGIRRNTVHLPHEIRLFQADLTEAGMLRKLPTATHVVFAAAPDEATEEAYRSTYVDGVRTLIDALVKQGQKPETFVFISSTAVYAQEGGEWVDEDSPTEPQDFRGQVLLEAEKLVKESPFQSVVLRFGGIYGPGREHLLDRLREGHRTGGDEPVYRNRIHVDDCVGMIYKTLEMGAPKPLYLGVDSEPADMRAVERWLTERMGLPAEATAPAKGEGDEDASHAPRLGNKRCRNDAIMSTRFSLRYPTFREGYSALLRAQATAHAQSA